jgi:hypothetical protein
VNEMGNLEWGMGNKNKAATGGRARVPVDDPIQRTANTIGGFMVGKTQVTKDK